MRRSTGQKIHLISSSNVVAIACLIHITLYMLGVSMSDYQRISSLSPQIIRTTRCVPYCTDTLGEKATRAQKVQQAQLRSSGNLRPTKHETTCCVYGVISYAEKVAAARSWPPLPSSVQCQSLHRQSKSAPLPLA